MRIIKVVICKIENGYTVEVQSIAGYKTYAFHSLAETLGFIEKEVYPNYDSR